MTSSVLIVALVVPMQTGGERPWEVVTSSEGHFTVEMPVRPNFSSTRTRTGPGGRVRILITGCRTPAGSYIANKIVYPTPIVQGAEEKQLDAERDEMVKEWQGEVIAQEKVQLEAYPGRDFTIRGQPQSAKGILTIRVREYLAGRAIYALVVVSAANRELPEDAGRFLGTLRLGVTREGPSAPVAAAPVAAEPEGRGREVPGWGMAFDPDHDCMIETEGKVLFLDVPGTLHDLNADINKLNAPRVLREVEGDFEAQVKVDGSFQPGAKSNNPKSVPYNGAGLLLWQDAGNYIRLERGAIIRAGRLGTFVDFEEREDGHRGAVHNGKLAPGTAYLRLMRRGGRISGAVSSDGVTWEALRPIDVNWPTRLKLGVAAVNSSSEPFAARLEEFVVKGKVAGGHPDEP
jgi:regulation of enolase protein 1 (concanavalin A-like superfamily)